MLFFFIFIFTFLDLDSILHGAYSCEHTYLCLFVNPYGNTNYFLYSLNLFINSNPGDIYNFVVKNKSWPFIQRFKKHTSLDNYKKCSSLVGEKNFLKFRNKWKGKSGIYKLTFLPCRLFTYFGSSKDLGERFKYHYYNTYKSTTFLALFIKKKNKKKKTFGWDSFALTVVE